MVQSSGAGSSSPLVSVSSLVHAIHTKRCHLDYLNVTHSGETHHSDWSQCSSCTSIHLWNKAVKVKTWRSLAQQKHVWWVFLFTFAQLCAVVHTLVIVFVLSAEVGIIVVTQRITSVPTVVGNEKLVAVHLIAHCEEAIFSVACLTLPVLAEY